MIFPNSKAFANKAIKAGFAVIALTWAIAHPTRASEKEPIGDEMLTAIQLLETTTLALSVEPTVRSKQLHTAYAELLNKHPNYAAGHVSYGAFLALEGLQGEALIEWQRALKLDPNNGDAAYLIGNYHIEQKEIRPAVTHLLQATANAPDEPLFHHTLATVLFLFRHDVHDLALVKDSPACMRLALDHYRLARDLAPLNLNYAKTYAETLYMLNPPNWPEAIDAWNHVLAMNANKDDARIHLARIQMKAGNNDEASRLLAQITTPRLTRLRNKFQAKIDKKMSQPND